MTKPASDECRDCEQPISSCHDGGCAEFGDMGTPYIEDERAAERYREIFADRDDTLCAACYQNRRDTAYGR